MMAEYEWVFWVLAGLTVGWFAGFIAGGFHAIKLVRTYHDVLVGEGEGP